MNLADAPRFLTYEELRAEVDRYEYRAEWVLSVYLHPWEGPVMRVVAQVPNSYHPGEFTELRVNSHIPPMASAEAFGHWLLWRLSQIESHEAREYLRRDGVVLVNPHDPIEPFEDGGSEPAPKP